MGCCDDKPMASISHVKMYVSSASLRWNANPDNPAKLPAIILEAGGKRHKVDRVLHSGESMTVQDTDSSPQVWVELRGTITGTFEGKPVVTIVTQEKQGWSS